MWFAGLDGLRGIAAMGVLITHAGITSGYVVRPGGQVDLNGLLAPLGSALNYMLRIGPDLALRAEAGVAVFFVLSGFLLYRPFVSARMQERPGQGTRRYLRHRFWRIYPAYWVAFIVLTLILDAREQGSVSPSELVLYLTLMQSFSTETALGGIQQAWTLHNEVMFYLLLPLWGAVWAWLTVRLRPRRALTTEIFVLFVLAAGALTWRAWIVSVRPPNPQGNQLLREFDPRLHWLLGQFHLFVPGMVLALAYEWYRRNGRTLDLAGMLRWLTPVSWVLAATCFWVVATQIGLSQQLGTTSSPWQDTRQQLLYAGVGIFLVAPIALAGGRLPLGFGWLRSWVMVTLGLLSYSIYLWHEGLLELYFRMPWVSEDARPIFTDTPFWLMTLYGIVISVAIAALSYLIVEKPALRLKDPLRARKDPR